VLAVTKDGPGPCLYDEKVDCEVRAVLDMLLEPRLSLVDEKGKPLWQAP
jgi:hypothetical protein